MRQSDYERWSFNRALSMFKRGLDNGIWWDEYTLAKDLRSQRPAWLGEDYPDLSKTWAKGSDAGCKRLGRAVANWLSPEMPNRFPRFNRDGRAQESGRASCLLWGGIVADERKVKLPGVG